MTLKDTSHPDETAGTPRRGLPVLLRRLASDARGNVAIIFGVAMPAILAAVGLSIDVALWTLQQRELQSSADSAALAAARELYLANMSSYKVDDVAKTIVEANMKGGFSKDPVSVTVKTDLVGRTASGDTITESGAVLVSVTQHRADIFSGLFFGDPGYLTVEAVARILTGGRICVIGLETKSAKAIELEKRARVTAVNCSVYSNSTNKNGIKSGDSAVLKAELICSAGGKLGGKGNFSPEPLLDCPRIPDPLAGREAPPIGPCEATNLVIENESRTLLPGTYCGGLTVGVGGEVDLRPGVYVMDSGPLHVSDGGSLDGENVGFYFTGKKATIKFEADSSISLTAPKDGPMAGLLVFEDRNAKANNKHHILSNDARVLLGTIYLPNGWLAVDAESPVADHSAYTAIVAKKMSLSEGPNLVLNANYDGTDIPVPNGIGPVGGNIVLAR